MLILQRLSMCPENPWQPELDNDQDVPATKARCICMQRRTYARPVSTVLHQVRQKRKIETGKQ